MIQESLVPVPALLTAPFSFYSIDKCSHSCLRLGTRMYVGVPAFVVLTSVVALVAVQGSTVDLVELVDLR